MQDVFNAADKLMDEERVAELVKSRKANELGKYMGLQFDNGFTIAEDMALSIIKYYTPDADLTGVESYTITTVGDTTMLICRDEHNIVRHTVEMPKDVEPVIAAPAPTFEEQIREFKTNTETYKKVRWVGYAFITLVVVAFIAAVNFLL